MHALCSQRCALAEVSAKKKAAQADRVQTRAKLEALRPLSHFVAKAQAAFNRYIRERDAGLPCISCGTFEAVQWHAGHYLTTAARPELRFNEDNVHRQCSQCNKHKSGNVSAYRVGLIERIGLARVEALEGPHPPAKWTREQLIEMRTTYASKARNSELTGRTRSGPTKR
jgi:Bacteriophage Lambda NinG protein